MINSPRAAALKTVLSLGACTSALLCGVSAQAQNADLGENLGDEVIITATRRAQDVASAPLSVVVLRSEQIAKQGLGDLAAIAAWTPGLHIAATGARQTDRITMRGLNADGPGPRDNGTVSTYIGDIPLYVDLKLNDLERVEVLLGPQGTLYGEGTLGGAVRYLPTKPKLGELSASGRADIYGYSKGDDVSTDFGATVNVPLGDDFALRGSIDVLSDAGYIDYARVVREIGVSNPDPDLTDANAVAANLNPVKDANTEDTVSVRLAARYQPSDDIDATLTYYGQFQEAGGRNHNGVLAAGTGRYESASRVLEPSERDDELLALEIIADLGFAELTSATGLSRYSQQGQRDQTDFLIPYSYGVFPSFTAITDDRDERETISQELRLLSKNDSRLDWLVGGFYSKSEGHSYSHEFTPGFGVFAIDAFGFETNLELDAEYDSFSRSRFTQKAIFGETGYQLTPKWHASLGGRAFAYEVEIGRETNFPYYMADGYQVSTLSDAKALGFDTALGSEDDGQVFKLSSSYAVSDAVNIYGAISQGYRIGGVNSVDACPDPLPVDPDGCGLPRELTFEPDKTVNYELGLKGRGFDNRLSASAAVYYIDWDGIQLDALTQNGGLPIAINGKGARSAGFETSFTLQPLDNFNVRGTYAYTSAQLTEDAPGVYPTDYFQAIEPDLTGPVCDADYDNPLCLGAGGVAGDRLPGSPEHQMSLYADYTWAMPSQRELTASYGVSYTGDVLTRIGSRANGDTLDSYTLSNASVSLTGDAWTLSLYANNLFDSYAETFLAYPTSQAAIQTYGDADGGVHSYRAYSPNVLAPRTLGLRAQYSFQ